MLGGRQVQLSLGVKDLRDLLPKTCDFWQELEGVSTPSRSEKWWPKTPSFFLLPVRKNSSINDSNLFTCSQTRETVNLELHLLCIISQELEMKGECCITQFYLLTAKRDNLHSKLVFVFIHCLL